MKFLNILLLVIFAVACHLSFSVAEDAGVVKRIAALRRPVGKAAKPSTTTTPAPAEEEENDYSETDGEKEYPDEPEDATSTTTTTTTTETPKRIGPVIRPFRSNDDFLNSLKRRQMIAKKNKLEKPAPKASRPTASQDSQEEAEESAPVAAPAPSKGFNKPNSSLSRRKLSKPSKSDPAEDIAAEETEQEQKEEAKPKRPLGRLALRKRN